MKQIAYIFIFKEKVVKIGLLPGVSLPTGINIVPDTHKHESVQTITMLPQDVYRICWKARLMGERTV